MRTASRSVVAFQGRPVHAHVLHPGVGIAGNTQRCGQVGRGIEARCRHRHRQPRESTAGASQFVTGDHHLLHGAVATSTRGIGLAIARIQAAPMPSTGWPIPAA